MPSQHLSQADFAKHIGRSRPYVTQLKQAGRLVMEGRKVLVDDSMALIAETADPNRVDVVQRHAVERDDIAQDGDAEAVLVAKASHAQSRAVKEEYAAKKAKLDYEREAGLVVEAAALRREATNLGALLRSRFENMPDQLAPELAPMDDTARIHAVLMEHVEQVLADVSRELERLAA